MPHKKTPPAAAFFYFNCAWSIDFAEQNQWTKRS
jgi:hypothetical protein